MCWRRFLTQYELKIELEMVLILQCLILSGLEVVSLDEFNFEMAIKICFAMSQCNTWENAALPKTKISCFQGPFHILKAVLPHAFKSTQFRELVC